jgi:hypothetical protein
MFNFSVIVIKKVLMAQAMSVGFFNFSSFTSNLGGNLFHGKYFHCLFVMFHVVFILLDFAVTLL